MYSDPLTKILVDLYENLNFEHIPEYMKELEVFLYSDFFFATLGEEFINVFLLIVRLRVVGSDQEGSYFGL